MRTIVLYALLILGVFIISFIMALILVYSNFGKGKEEWVKIKLDELCHQSEITLNMYSFHRNESLMIGCSYRVNDGCYCDVQKAECTKYACGSSSDEIIETFKLWE